MRYRSRVCAPRRLGVVAGPVRLGSARSWEAKRHILPGEYRKLVGPHCGRLHPGTDSTKPTARLIWLGSGCTGPLKKVGRAR